MFDLKIYIYLLIILTSDFIWFYSITQGLSIEHFSTFSALYQFLSYIAVFSIYTKYLPFI